MTRAWMPVTAQFARLLMIVVLLYAFGLLSMGLDRSPAIHGDELWIPQPGLNLIQQGVYGAPMFDGVHRMGQLYLEFMPLYSLVQGATLHVLGIGAFQLRLTNVFASLLCLSVVYAMLHKMHHRLTGLVAVVLALCWQWMAPHSHEQVISGIPFVDFARVARYDMLAALFSCAATAVCMHAWKKQVSGWIWMLVGALLGLGVLSHVYVAAWLPALVLATCVRPLTTTPQRTRRRTHVAGIMVGCGLVVMPWLIIVLANAQEFSNQSMTSQGRLDTFNLQSILTNLINEPGRFSMHVTRGMSTQILGFWAFAIGMPATLIGLGWLARKGDRRALWLLIVFAVAEGLQAALLKNKPPNYLPAIQLLIVSMVAFVLMEILARAGQKTGRSVCAGFVVLILTGLLGHRALFAHISSTTSIEHVWADMRPVLKASQRVLAFPGYWPAASTQRFQAMQSVYYLSDPAYTSFPIPYEATFGMLKPDAIIVDSNLRQALDTRQAGWVREVSIHMSGRRPQIVFSRSYPGLGTIEIVVLE